MEEQKISYLAFESSQARMERINTRLWLIIIILILSLIGSNAGWIYYESQWKYVTTETSIEASQNGDENIVNGGDLYYGTGSKDNKEN